MGWRFAFESFKQWLYVAVFVNRMCVIMDEIWIELIYVFSIKLWFF